jgi:hypothetical protein
MFFRDLARVPVDPHGAQDDDALLAPLADAWYRPGPLRTAAPGCSRGCAAWADG